MTEASDITRALVIQEGDTQKTLGEVLGDGEELEKTFLEAQAAMQEAREALVVAKAKLLRWRETYAAVNKLKEVLNGSHT